MKFKQYVENLNNFLEEHPELAYMETIYAVDDEGNDYHSVYNEPSLCQVEDVNTHSLEMVGFYDDDSDEISKEDCNCICIN